MTCLSQMPAFLQLGHKSPLDGSHTLQNYFTPPLCSSTPKPGSFPLTLSEASKFKHFYKFFTNFLHICPLVMLLQFGVYIIFFPILVFISPFPLFWYLYQRFLYSGLYIIFSPILVFISSFPLFWSLYHRFPLFWSLYHLFSLFWSLNHLFPYSGL